MKFTKLRLAGFKSFVDPTELIIAPAPGLAMDLRQFVRRSKPINGGEQLAAFVA
ncbi:MAG: hypothetical protein V3R75_01915 [Alphaproteobacteria bacterium]